MMDTPNECEVNSDELPVCQNEINTNSSENTGENDFGIDCDAKRKIKRKKSTSIDGITVLNETIDATDIAYAIIQNENKRQKIELLVDREANKENQTKLSNEERLTSDKSSISKEKSPKDAKCTNESSKLRLKYENIHTNTVQKLNAQAEQLRMEISTLRTALANEQNSVRVLR